MTAVMISTDVAAKTHAILAELEARANPVNVAGMARYGIVPARAYGVPGPDLRRMAKEAGTDHRLAAALWKTGAHEARAIAVLVDDPAQVTRAQVERWAAAFDSWAICDGASCHLFDRTPHAVALAREWPGREEEFVKRAGFVVMAGLAVHDKAAPDALFLEFLGLVERGADDPRSMVKKGVNWALRQIGKRNLALNRAAVAVCRRLVKRRGAARWVGSDALRELTAENTLARLQARQARVTRARSICR